jgi:transketolase
MVSPRSAYGKALAEMAMINDQIVALDAEVKNSTYVVDFEKVFPERFFEMFIAEQTMVGVATGIARRGYIPFVSTFSAFFTRAFDQIRMASYADVPLVCVGSHCGVSIGEDGASQMGLEDIAMFRSVLGSVVLYPADAVSMRACVQIASDQKGITYIRSTRAELPVLYKENENFVAGGSKTLRESDQDSATIVASGITLHEALKAYDILQKEGVLVRVIDAYSVKPIDTEAIQKAVRETGKIIVVEDHFAEGGLADAVRESLTYNLQPITHNLRIVSLAVRKRPRSGKPEELLGYEEIDAEAIVRAIKNYE